MYVNGHVDIFDMVDINLFTVVTLDMIVIKLGYTGEYEPMFYNYLRPLTSLDEGLYALACEEDVRFLATLVRSFKSIEVYMEHGVTALDSYIKPPRFRATIEDITNKPSSIAAIEHKSEKMLLLTWHDSSKATKEWHDSSEATKEPICEYVKPMSLPQHDSSTPCKDFVYESITPRCMPHCMLTPLNDESVITYTLFSNINLSFVSQQASPSQVIENVRQLSFEETELDGEAGFGHVARSGVESSGFSHDESFGVDDLDLNLN
ncbi:hypothetical protein Tco_0103162 [Tanacetum coccineum]